jgi:hypothetical protein
MSKLETITIDTPSGSNTMQIGSTNTATINLGASGDTINIPAGATIANAGTATGFASTPVAGTEAFSVGLSGNQTLTNNTWTKITFDSEEFDVGSNFASNKFTAPSAGKYVFTHAIYMWISGGSDWENYSIKFYKNGGAVNSTYSQFSLQSANFLEVAIPASYVLDLSANDYIEVYAKLSSPGASSRQVDAVSRFQGYKLA